MKKILYLMSMDWNWIKQRPQFIAEELMKQADVLVVTQYRYKRKGYQSRNLNKNVYAMKVIPSIDRFGYIRGINVLLKKVIVNRLIRVFQPDCIYLTDPEEIEWIPRKYKGDIIYDCMDNHIDLALKKFRRKVCIRCEKKLAERAGYIIYSSEYLKKLFNSRYILNNRINEKIIRNGYDGLEITNLEEHRNKIFTICYVGTISYWFDFNIIIHSLEYFDNIKYLLVGPLEREITIPQHDRIEYIGTVEHDQIYSKTKECDCYIMPFVLNEAIKAVDPVKMYEYINFGKNIISVKYDEIKRYENFAYLYCDEEEYIDAVKTLLADNTLKYTCRMRKELLSDSTWASRAQVIIQIMEGTNIIDGS